MAGASEQKVRENGPGTAHATAWDREVPMKAIVCTAYGGPDVLKLEEVEMPRPKNGEVLVRVRATTASRADCEIRRFEFPAWVWLPVRLAFGVVRPRVRILGQEFAGEVEALGQGVASFAPGDRVYGTTGIRLGAYAEYACVGGRRAGSVVARCRRP